jgi:hypothetical protein
MASRFKGAILVKRIVITTLSFVVVAWTTLDEPVRGQQGNALVYADSKRWPLTGLSVREAGWCSWSRFRRATFARARSKGSRAWTPGSRTGADQKDDPSHTMKFDFAIQAPNE